MTYSFQHLVDTLGGPGGRNLEAYYRGLGIPQQGRDELSYIPAPYAKGIVTLFNINRRHRPNRTYDPPFLSYNQRVTFKFLLEYDVDWSRATIDGRLSEGFDPQDALKKVTCPMLLLQASFSRWCGDVRRTGQLAISSPCKRFTARSQKGMHHHTAVTLPPPLVDNSGEPFLTSSALHSAGCLS